MTVDILPCFNASYEVPVRQASALPGEAFKPVFGLSVSRGTEKGLKESAEPIVVTNDK